MKTRNTSVQPSEEGARFRGSFTLPVFYPLFLIGGDLGVGGHGFSLDPLLYSRGSVWDCSVLM
jgi:hypothetical protein